MVIPIKTEGRQITLIYQEVKDRFSSRYEQEPKVGQGFRGIFSLKRLSERRDCVTILLWSLRATEGSVAISLFPTNYEIAAVVSLPRNDITTQFRI
jgi:hypothetical protein